MKLNNSDGHIQKIIRKALIFVAVAVITIFVFTGASVRTDEASEVTTATNNTNTVENYLRLYPDIISTLAADAFVHPISTITVQAAYDGDEQTVENETEQDPEIIEPEVIIDPYEDYLTANTDNLNIRATPSTDAEVIGILNIGDSATIKDSMENWYYIESGECIGWVYKQYTITGSDAYTAIQNHSSNIATVDVDGLRLRTEATIDSSIITTLSQGTNLSINSEQDGWVNVTYGDQTGYVSSDYVNISTTYAVASTIEEINAAQNYNYEVSLLACIIWCEAGNQSYTGKVAVGAVVLNRVESSDFADTIYGVIYESGQFSPVVSGWYDRAYANREWNDECVEAAKDALAGSDPTDGCLYFSRGSSGYIVIGDHAFKK